MVLSNLNTAEAVEKSLENGVYDYLVKVDYSLDDLVKIVKKSLKNKTIPDNQKNMEEDILKKFEAQEKKMDEIYRSVEKMRKYFCGR